MLGTMEIIWHEKQKGKRIEWIDVAKGIGIILVLIAHITENQYIIKFIEAFLMPLFFIISGFLCFNRNKNNINYKKILIPYFIFAILTFIYWALIERKIRGQNDSILLQGLNILYGAGGENYIFNISLWFIPCYLTTEFAFSYIKTLNKRKICITLFISSIIGFLIPKIIKFRLPMGIDTAFTAIVFYGIGYLLGSDYNRIIEKIKKYNFWVFFIILLICYIISYNFNITVNMNNLIYGNYFLYYISSIIGSLSLILISSKIKLKFLMWIGKNTMTIMCVHEPIKRVLLLITSKILRLNIDIARKDILFTLINTILLTIVLIPIIITNKITEKIKIKINESSKFGGKNENCNSA